MRVPSTDMPNREPRALWGTGVFLSGAAERVDVNRLTWQRMKAGT